MIGWQFLACKCARSHSILIFQKVLKCKKSLHSEESKDRKAGHLEVLLDFNMDVKKKEKAIGVGFVFN